MSTMITNIRSPLLRALAQAQTRSLSSSAASVKFEERVAVVTGANVGIGKAAATELARRGARVILACRDTDKAEAARLEIIQETGVASEKVQVREIDLSSFRSVR